MLKSACLYYILQTFSLECIKSQIRLWRVKYMFVHLSIYLGLWFLKSEFCFQRKNLGQLLFISMYLLWELLWVIYTHIQLIYPFHLISDSNCFTIFRTIDNLDTMFLSWSFGKCIYLRGFCRFFRFFYIENQAVCNKSSFMSFSFIVLLFIFYCIF